MSSQKIVIPVLIGHPEKDGCNRDLKALGCMIFLILELVLYKFYIFKKNHVISIYYREMRLILLLLIVYSEYSLPL